MVLVCEKCESVLDYDLVLAHDDHDKREFHISFQISERDQTLVARGGTGDERISFGGKSITAGKFRLEFPELKPGDYGFFPPGRASVTYTFQLVER